MDIDSFFVEDDEVKYFKMRDRHGPNVVWLSKITEFPNSITGEVTSKRTIRKLFDKEEQGHIVNVKGEYMLRCSEAGRDQVKVLVYNDHDRAGLVLQKFTTYGHRPVEAISFKFWHNEFQELLDFLYLTKFIDLSNRERFQLKLDDLKSMVLVKRSEQELIDAFKNLHGTDRLHLLEKFRDAELTKEDLDILSGRKEGLEQFRRKLYEERDWTETEWQTFFKSNPWIFGYGLDYRFLSIIQKEPAVSDVDVDGHGTAFSDFLLGTSDFTVLVEMKLPETQLLGSGQNRSRSWKLSNDLFYAVSQILAQKSKWQVKSATGDYHDSSGNRIQQRTFDPKCILIIGSNDQFVGSDREREVKQQTFELFRRDSRNIEIVTYDELYERAYFIVNQKVAPKPTIVEPDDDDDIPF